MEIAVAMIEPMYAINVGYVSRIMKNFGYYSLYLVNPSIDMVEANKFSTHGSDILESSVTKTLSELRKKYDILVGTTAICSTGKIKIDRDYISPVDLAEIVDNSNTRRLCLLLGRENSGLRNEELRICDIVVRIETYTDYATMNISHALAIILYEMSNSKLKNGISNLKESAEFATGKDIDLLLAYLNKSCEISGYDQHKRPLLNSAFRRILGRNTPTRKEVMLIVSLLRKCIIAIQRPDRERLISFSRRELDQRSQPIDD
jgi:tRNA/rRNA methyltransferase